MGKRGPQRKPFELMQLDGNPGKRAINKRGPKFGGSVKCQKWLGAEGAKEFRRVKAELEASELLTKVDQAAFLIYCHEYAIMVTAARDLKLHHDRPCLSQIRVEKRDIKGNVAFVPALTMAEYGFYETLNAEQKREYLIHKGMMSGEAEYYAVTGIPTNLEALGYGIEETDKGNRVQHPSLGIMRTAEKRVLQVAASFGMTPSARTGLEVPQEGDQTDMLDELDNAKAVG